MKELGKRQVRIAVYSDEEQLTADGPTHLVDACAVVLTNAAELVDAAHTAIGKHERTGLQRPLPPVLPSGEGSLQPSDKEGKALIQCTGPPRFI